MKTSEKNNMLKEDTIYKFMIDVKLIQPIEKIIAMFKNRDIRDCDLNWLNIQLDNFMKFAAQTLKIKAIPQSLIPSTEIQTLNDFTYSYYMKYFSGLLEYFKSLKDLQ